MIAAILLVLCVPTAEPEPAPAAEPPALGAPQTPRETEFYWLAEEAAAASRGFEIEKKACEDKLEACNKRKQRVQRIAFAAPPVITARAEAETTKSATPTRGMLWTILGAGAGGALGSVGGMAVGDELGSGTLGAAAGGFILAITGAALGMVLDE